MLWPISTTISTGTIQLYHHPHPLKYCSNNNNNNNDNINFQQSVNTVVSGNINVANQINVMNVAGRKRRDATSGITPEMKRSAAKIARQGFEAMLTLNRSLKDEESVAQLNRRLLLYASI